MPTDRPSRSYLPQIGLTEADVDDHAMQLLSIGFDRKSPDFWERNRSFIRAFGSISQRIKLIGRLEGQRMKMEQHDRRKNT